MTASFHQTEEALKKNVAGVRRLINFDRDILDFAINTLTDLQEKLTEQHGIKNPALLARNALHMLKSVRRNDSLRSKYQVIFNQCIVLLVSVFASATSELFRNGINALARTGKSADIKKEELRFTIGELEEVGYDLTESLGRLLAEKKDISFQDMKSIGRAFRDCFAIEIPKDRTVNNIIFAQASRHIIVHDAGKINDRFLRQVSGATPRDINLSPVEDTNIEFSTNEIEQVAESMLIYFSDLRNNVERKFNDN